MTHIEHTPSNDPSARRRRADELFKAGDYHSSKELFESLHDGTDASIEACLGYIYSIRDSADYDRNLAIGYFKAAAAKGDIYSLHTLGGLYAENEEWDEAAKWYRVASNLGDAACSYNLYRILKIRPDAVAAGEALHKAADQGHPVARQQLAIKYIIGKYGLRRIPTGLLMYVTNVGVLWRYTKEQSAQGR